MSPAPDAGGWREMWLSLTFEQQPTGALLARLAVDESADRLVEVELPGELLARLLAGETLPVRGRAAERLGKEPEPRLDVGKPDVEPEPDGPGLTVVKQPETVPSRYSSLVDEPPEGTVPITRVSEVARDEAVVAYIRGQWRDATVLRKDVGTLFLRYSREGPFGRDLRTSVRVDWVRRRP
jgi:hypothetical protein